MSKPFRIFFRILFFLYIGLLVYLCFGHFSSLPDVSRTLWGFPTDKVVHFLMFLPFPILAFLAFDRYTETLPQTLSFAGGTFLVGCLMAMGTEVGQARLTNHRMGEFQDFTADVLALSISTLIVIVWDLLKQRKKA